MTYTSAATIPGLTSTTAICAPGIFMSPIRGGAVEGDEGLHVSREERGLDAHESRRGGEERGGEGEIARYAKEHEVKQLDGQKQENVLLEETIDRMRFDLDEMRNNSSGAAAGGSSGQSSAANTMSKSLGTELLGKMKGGWGGMESESEEEEEEPTTSSSTTPGVDDDDAGGEDVIQTIIIRKKRVKEYSDSSTQYEPHLFLVFSRVQTDPAPKILTASATIQTDPEPVIEPPPAPNTAEMEIETEPEQPQPEASTSAAKAVGPASTPAYAPPAYKQVLSPEEQEEHDWRGHAER
ncbi:hypothetical protein B0H11DRAFT_2380276 [Mycena galericulata]|nr:hypothetical protein B0H11DRAFT_2380276 [Mycena galericulata]